jgi:hypothetical protein
MGARIFPGRNRRQTGEETREGYRACPAARRFRRAWCRCWLVGERAGHAQGCAGVSGLAGLEAVSEKRRAAVRGTRGLPCSNGQPSRVVGSRAWPIPLCPETDSGTMVHTLGGKVYIEGAGHGIRRVTWCMSPSSRAEGNAEKGQPSRHEGGVVCGGKRGCTVIVGSGGRRVKWHSEQAQEKRGAMAGLVRASAGLWHRNT